MAPVPSCSSPKFETYPSTSGCWIRSLLEVCSASPHWAAPASCLLLGTLPALPFASAAGYSVSVARWRDRRQARRLPSSPRAYHTCEGYRWRTTYILLNSDAMTATLAPPWRCSAAARPRTACGAWRRAVALAVPFLPPHSSSTFSLVSWIGKGWHHRNRLYHHSIRYSLYAHQEQAGVTCHALRPP